MFHHLSLGVADLDRAAAFYDAVLAPLGYVRLSHSARSVCYGARLTRPPRAQPRGTQNRYPPPRCPTLPRPPDPMTAAVKAVLKQAMQLSPEERAEVANALDGMSADAPALSPDDLAAAWRPELDRRREELERGEVQTVDAREAIAGIRARLRIGK
jgi:hypothetical protein